MRTNKNKASTEYERSNMKMAINRNNEIGKQMLRNIAISEIKKEIKTPEKLEQFKLYTNQLNNLNANEHTLAETKIPKIPNITLAKNNKENRITKIRDNIFKKISEVSKPQRGNLMTTKNKKKCRNLLSNNSPKNIQKLIQLKSILEELSKKTSQFSKKKDINNIIEEIKKILP